MMRPLRIVVLGTVASEPWAGMAWMHMQLAVGLRRLGHDVYYYEVTSAWPYDPTHRMRLCDGDYALPYLARVAEAFGLGGRWACRRSYSDDAWFGMGRAEAEELLATADLTLNVSGATRARTREGLKVGRLVYFGTDPGYHELAFANGDPDARRLVEEHDEVVTYGENIGTPGCPIPPLPGLRSRTRQPVLLDLWEAGPPSNEAFTTVCNWKQEGRDIEYDGDTYYWSKDREFLKLIDLPRRTSQPVELAMGLGDSTAIRPFQETVSATGVDTSVRTTLESNGWRLVDAHAFTTDLWAYRDYLRASRGEFTVAKDMNVRLRSGWFSERSACYLAAGRPVITQDTGFGRVLPTGEGLFAFDTVEDILAAFEVVNSDYERHCRAAREIAHEYFRAEAVLARMLEDLGF